MAKVNNPVYGFNQGEIGEEVLGRVTLEIYPHTASLVENFLPELQGGMHFRPGMKFCAEPSAADVPQILWKFQYSASQPFVLVFEPTGLRIMKDGGIIVREAAGATIANGAFSVPGGWTDITVASADDGTTPASSVVNDTVASGSSGSTGEPPVSGSGEGDPD